VIKQNSSFAIVIDLETFNHTKDAVYAYRDAVEKDGLSAYILVFNNETADAIKNKIRELYYRKPSIEGVVFIGDVPIPMIRDAQHMSSAFKMDQSADWFDSSIPSDRFYEDFDLKFDFIKTDSLHKLCYYYSLRNDSPQKINKEIYSGRIKSPYNDPAENYKQISDYLYKAVRLKSQPDAFDNALIFAGHGYHSESLVTWADEYTALREQLPQLFLPGGRLRYLYHSSDPNMKNILMRELENKDLDFAMFHAHGDVAMQYLVAYPTPGTLQENAAYIQYYLRDRLRYAKKKNKNLEEEKNSYKVKYNIPEDWFAGAFTDSVNSADSILNHKMDLYSDDLSQFTPQAKFVIFDECFNGSFHQENNISSRYIFGKGNTVSAFANSVNVLQDLWADELLGTLNNGMRIGQLHKIKSKYLENHIIGDPTFHFKSNGDLNLSEIINSNDESDWKKLLDNSNSEIRCLALLKLFNITGKQFESGLVKIFENDKSDNVRFQALSCLAALNSDTFKSILPLAANDPFEFIRRKALMFMSKISDNKYIPVLIDRMMTDPSPRIMFNAKQGLGNFDQDSVITQLNKYLDNLPKYMRNETNEKALKDSFVRIKEWLFNDILKKVWSDKVKTERRLSEIRTFRNYNFNQSVPELSKFIGDKSQPEQLRVAAIEALGWYTYNYQKRDILSAVEKVAGDNSNPSSVVREADKTKRRLTEGCNVSLTP
jgi:hypothetical protein